LGGKTARREKRFREGRKGMKKFLNLFYSLLKRGKRKA